MLRNYFKFALRNLIQHKRHAFVNIMGLAIAIAACLVIFLVLKHEYSYDKYHKKAANIYQVVNKTLTPDGDNFSVSSPFPMTRALRTEYPQILFAELFTSNGNQVTVMNSELASSGKKFIEPAGVFYADPQLFRLFDVTWLSGNESLLENDNSVILSKTEATKYFDTWQNAIGKYIRLDNTVTARVGGIIEDVPSNSDFPFKVVLSYKTFLSNAKALGLDGMVNEWGSETSRHQIYALLPDAVKPQTINANLNGFVKKYFTDEPNRTDKRSQFLQPLSNIHFDTRFGNNGTHTSSKATLYTLAFIGVLILLMACINFINLSTALAVKRSKEIGIRKVMGSNGRQITSQVLIETLVIVLFATCIATALAYFSLPYLKYIVQIEESLTLFTSASVLFILLAVVFTTLLSGAYPALVLSRFKPVEAMKNKINSTKLGGISLRRILVVLQFSFSQILIIATIIALNQMRFVQNTDLGFNKKAILLLQGNKDSATLSKRDAFKATLLQIPGVESVTFTSDAPSSDNNWNMNFSFDNAVKDYDFYPSVKFADADYQKTFGLKMAAGRFYNMDTMPQAVINETLCTKLGIKDPEKAVGKTIRIGGGAWRTVVGVVKDFKNNSLREAIPPTILTKRKSIYTLTAIKLNTNNLSGSNAAIQAAWNTYFPEYAYNSSFFDDSINNFYIQEQRMSTLYKVYACLAIFISCLGLYGLVSFMAVQKTKEVGIRKVLGASIGNIVFLFSKEFTILIGIAFVIAVPVGYYMMNTWLQDFVFRVNIGPGVFFTAIIVSLIIAWITVGYKAIKAAVANPIKSLRTE
jgi:putative ABC transport system permease protein